LKAGIGKERKYSARDNLKGYFTVFHACRVTFFLSLWKYFLCLLASFFLHTFIQVELAVLPAVIVSYLSPDIGCRRAKITHHRKKLITFIFKVLDVPFGELKTSNVAWT
jgi:hypothetical protein